MKIRKMKGSESMKLKLKVKDDFQQWKMDILKDWERSYNSILNGTFEGDPAEKVFNEIYQDVFGERRWKEDI